ncbi:MAG: hypothetical protein IPJ65_13055 [Archangiaceae bacterium]|nr:hypothetical protein [Archangiaceae bacterium]
MTKTSILLGVLMFTSLAQAQGVRDRVEKAGDRQALRQDAREKRDDLRDGARLESLLARFDAARAHNDVTALLGVDAELRRLIAGELAESRAEYGKDRAEVRQDQRELGSDRRELARDQVTGRGPAVKVDDRHDRNDDRRDLAGDRRDARDEVRHAVRVAEIDAEYARLQGRADRGSLDRKRSLLTELLALSRHELRQDSREAAEDRRELREDRRETREDVRQR